MTKRISGYQVTAVFFVPADPNDLQAMVDANDAISQFCADAQNRGFKALDIQQKFIQRREVPDEPTFHSTTKPMDDAMRESIGMPPRDEMPPIPKGLDRRKST